MGLFLTLVFILLTGVVSFVMTHLRPLTAAETERLATRRRAREVGRYFAFDARTFRVNPELKEGMYASGRFYRIEESLCSIPGIAAGLLKYKKHEWMVVAFEKQRRVDLIWVNKGVDRSSVSSYLPPAEIIRIRNQGGYDSVLVFHNHPNPDPGRYSCTRPSEQDLKFARDWSGLLNEHGLNVLQFVCERGRHYQYCLSPADGFIPLSGFIGEIGRANGTSRLANLGLHVQRILWLIELRACGSVASRGGAL